MFPVLLRVTMVYKKVWFEVSEGVTHPSSPSSLGSLFGPKVLTGAPCPLRTAFPWYYNLNVKCHPHSQRCEHLFPSWGLTLSGIYLEEEGHWLGRGRWSPVRFLCQATFVVLSLLLYCGCRVSRCYMFVALQLPGHEELAVSQRKPFLLNMPLVGT